MLPPQLAEVTSAYKNMFVTGDSLSANVNVTVEASLTALSAMVAPAWSVAVMVTVGTTVSELTTNAAAAAFALPAPSEKPEVLLSSV